MKTFSERSRADLIAIDSGYKELKRSEEKYREIVNSVPDIIITTNPEGKILFANRSVSSLGFDCLASAKSGPIELKS
jgi:PAS domain-containing protein